MTADELYEELLPFFRPWVDDDGIFAFWVPVKYRHLGPRAWETPLRAEHHQDGPVRPHSRPEGDQMLMRYRPTWKTRLRRLLVGLQVTWDVILVIPHYHELTEMLRGWIA